MKRTLIEGERAKHCKHKHDNTHPLKSKSTHTGLSVCLYVRVYIRMDVSVLPEERGTNMHRKYFSTAFK